MSYGGIVLNAFINLSNSFFHNELDVYKTFLILPLVVKSYILDSFNADLFFDFAKNKMGEWTAINMEHLDKNNIEDILQMFKSHNRIDWYEQILNATFNENINSNNAVLYFVKKNEDIITSCSMTIPKHNIPLLEKQKMKFSNHYLILDYPSDFRYNETITLNDILYLKDNYIVKFNLLSFFLRFCLFLSLS